MPADPHRVVILRRIVAELMDLPEDHAAVARACISVMAPCLVLLIADRPSLRRAFPALGLEEGTADSLVHHLTEFALAGLSAVANGAHATEVFDRKDRTAA